ncbi:hypothetical protein CEXT_125791 [Caerostris extrusa]|uniref:Uncharacterized protein n=1 Tax=Caerostris extrusa TaxID=172846 RepID=A0AAV4V8H2_CAEEX|nr:hypothetical protein CEXT_125791 [Caerostris extrusa]
MEKKNRCVEYFILIKVVTKIVAVEWKERTAYVSSCNLCHRREGQMKARMKGITNAWREKKGHPGKKCFTICIRDSVELLIGIFLGEVIG